MGERLGSSVIDVRPLHGGDINEAWVVTLSDQRHVFVKTNRAAPPEMFPREAEGLEWLAEPQSLRVPKVLAVSERFLALEWIAPGTPAADSGERLGRGLAALHRSKADCFGWPRDNFIGSLPQDNEPEEDWATFYTRRRLEPQLRMAVDRGRSSAAMRRGFQRLFARMPELVGRPEPPSRLHGDLWAGNLLYSECGEPVLIDPAVYGGHREMDLAMMRLFGGFGRPVFEAYEEAWPLSADAEERVELYQLYPLMVHVNLFGGSYIGAVERALSRWAP